MGNEQGTSQAPEEVPANAPMSEEELRKRGVRKLDEELRHKFSKGAQYNSASIPCPVHFPSLVIFVSVSITSLSVSMTGL